MNTPVIDLTPLAIERITLRVENGRWVAEYSCPRVKWLFGTSVLPTAFDSRMPGEEVKALVQSRHAGVKVEVVP